jgi:hypothetical protein
MVLAKVELGVHQILAPKKIVGFIYKLHHFLGH